MIHDYEKLLLYIIEQNLHDAHLIRPLANGKDVSKALGVKPGPWMARALEIIVEWQIRNPERSDIEGAFAEVTRRKEELPLTASSNK